MEATLVIVSAHTTPGGRVRLRLSDGTTVRAARGTRLADRRKGDVLNADDLAVLAGYGPRTDRWRPEPQADPTENALEAILELHGQPVDGTCRECGQSWPCPTWELARVEEGDR